MRKKRKRTMRKYWNDRLIRNRERLLDQTAETAYKELQKVYREIAESLMEKLDVLVAEMDKLGQGNVLASHQFSYNKYYEQLRDIQLEMQKLGIQEEKIMNADFTKYYKNNSTLVGEQLGIANKVDPEEVKQTVGQIWAEDGRSFSNRIWKDKQALMNKLDTGLTQIISTGTGRADLIKGLVKDAIATSYANSKRLVITELSRLYNTSTLKRYGEAGIQQVEWLAEIDSRTCPECRAMDGKRFPISQANYMIPAHPHCRCTWLAVIPDIKENSNGNMEANRLLP